MKVLEKCLNERHKKYNYGNSKHFFKYGIILNYEVQHNFSIHKILRLNVTISAASCQHCTENEIH